MFAAFTSAVLTIGVKDTSKMSGPRYEVMKVVIKFSARSSLYAMGYFWIDIQQDHSMCYKEYLGPDWSPAWTGAPTLVQNHTSIADGMVAVCVLFPSFVARINVLDIWGIGTLMTVMKSVFVERVGDDAKASKVATFKAIEERQLEFMAGKAKVPFLIYPEGSTSNGEYLMSFKKGAFASLLPIQPMTSLSLTQMISINPVAANFIACCSHPFKTLTQKHYPVFTPNDFFWANHQRPGE